MKVRISYGADVEEVPKELEMLFLFVSDKTQIVSRRVKQIEEFLHDDDIESAINLMDNLRLSLSDIDGRVADVSNIATGYVNYKENEGAENAGERRSSVDPTGDYPVSEPSEQPTGNPNSEGA